MPRNLDPAVDHVEYCIAVAAQADLEHTAALEAGDPDRFQETQSRAVLADLAVRRAYEQLGRDFHANTAPLRREAAAWHGSIDPTLAADAARSVAAGQAARRGEDFLVAAGALIEQDLKRYDEDEPSRLERLGDQLKGYFGSDAVLPPGSRDALFRTLTRARDDINSYLFGEFISADGEYASPAPAGFGSLRDREAEASVRLDGETQSYDPAAQLAAAEAAGQDAMERIKAAFPGSVEVPVTPAEDADQAANEAAIEATSPMSPDDVAAEPLLEERE